MGQTDPDQQKAVQQAAHESMDFHRKLWGEIVSTEIEKAKSELGVEFVEVDKTPFVEAVMPMHEELAAKSERLADLIERIKAVQ